MNSSRFAYVPPSRKLQIGVLRIFYKERRRQILLPILLCALLIPASPALAAEKPRLLIIPKLVGISYYDVVKQGVDEAAGELPGFEVVWQGPTQDRVEKQIELIEKAIASKPGVIAVAANDPVAIAPVLKKAQAAGIHVMSWDGDADFREFFVNLVEFDEFATALVEGLAAEIGPKGDIAIITTTFTAPNQLSWIEAIKKYIYAKHPGLKNADIRPAGENTEEAYRIAHDYLKTIPSLKGIIALGVPNLPGAAAAVKDAGLAGKVAVTGNSTPDLMRSYLKDGTVKKVVLWEARNHGYLTVYCASQLATGGFKEGAGFKAGRLGTVTPRRDGRNLQVALRVMIFTKDNVDQYRF